MNSSLCVAKQVNTIQYNTIQRTCVLIYACKEMVSSSSRLDKTRIEKINFLLWSFFYYRIFLLFVMMYVYRKSYYSSITSLYKWWARIAKSGKQSMLMLFSASIVSSAVPLPLFLLLLWWMWPFHYCCIYIILPIYIVTLVLSAIGVGWEKAMPSAQQGTMTVGTYLPILYQPSYLIIILAKYVARLQ